MPVCLSLEITSMISLPLSSFRMFGQPITSMKTYPQALTNMNSGSANCCPRPTTLLAPTTFTRSVQTSMPPSHLKTNLQPNVLATQIRTRNRLRPQQLSRQSMAKLKQVSRSLTQVARHASRPVSRPPSLSKLGVILVSRHWIPSSVDRPMVTPVTPMLRSTVRLVDVMCLTTVKFGSTSRKWSHTLVSSALSVVS